jgi:hypothetical protein
MIFTTKKLDDILIQAKGAIFNGRCFFRLEENTFFEEFLSLKIDDIKDIWPIIIELLYEIKSKNYTPLPDEFFCFIWKSRKMKKKMQMQFAFKNSTFYYISLCSKN